MWSRVGVTIFSTGDFNARKTCKRNLFGILLRFFSSNDFIPLESVTLCRWLVCLDWFGVMKWWAGKMILVGTYPKAWQRVVMRLNQPLTCWNLSRLPEYSFFSSGGSLSDCPGRTTISRRPPSWGSKCASLIASLWILLLHSTCLSMPTYIRNCLFSKRKRVALLVHEIVAGYFLLARLTPSKYKYSFSRDIFCIGTERGSSRNSADAFCLGQVCPDWKWKY